MSSSPSLPDRPKRLVDMEFKPGELPPADLPPVALDQESESPLEGKRRMGVAGWLALLSATLILLAVVVGSAASFAIRALVEGSVVDLVFLAAVVVFVGSVACLLGRQARAYTKLRSAERAREMAVQLSKMDSAGSGTRLVSVLKHLYSGNAPVLGALNAASEALQPHHTDRDVIELLNRDVFAAMDQRADERIRRAALRASIGVSACPHPALDALVVMGIAIALLQDLMSIYGLRHSTRGLYRVFTRILLTASSTAVMSTALEFAIKAAQDRLAGAVVGTAGEALIVARRMFALGALAKREIRPLPVPE